MLSSFNIVYLIGLLGANPESCILPSGDQVVTFSIATSDTYIDHDHKIEFTHWYKIELWGALADVAMKYLQRGDLVFVEGELCNERRTDKEGIERNTYKIRAGKMQILKSKHDKECAN